MLAAGGYAASLLAAETAPSTARVVVGGHPWIYASKLPRNDITPELPTIFADMQYAGLDGIELMSEVLYSNDAFEQIGELSQKHHLPIIGASFAGSKGSMCDRTKHAEILEHAEQVISRLAKLGGRTLGTSVGQIKGKKTPEQFDAQAEVLRKIIALGHANGVVLNLHNHTYEIADDLYDLKGTLARIPDVKLGPDIGWLVRGGVDPVAFVRQFGQQIVFCHIRDQTAEKKWSEAVGEGAVDYPAIAKALRDAGFHGDAVIELAFERGFTPTRPIRESFKISCEYVRKLFGEKSV
jgi:sugar phosphate isomerase/epimerase